MKVVGANTGRGDSEMIQRIMVPGIMEPVSHYCHVTRAGPMVWVSGIVGMDAEGNIPESTVDQFDMAIDVMDQCLKAAGASAAFFRARPPIQSLSCQR